MKNELQDLINNIKEDRAILLDKFFVARNFYNGFIKEYVDLLNCNGAIMLSTQCGCIIIENISELRHLDLVLFYCEDINVFRDNNSIKLNGVYVLNEDEFLKYKNKTKSFREYIEIFFVLGDDIEDLSKKETYMLPHYTTPYIEYKYIEIIENGFENAHDNDILDEIYSDVSTFFNFKYTNNLLGKELLIKYCPIREILAIANLILATNGFYFYGYPKQFSLEGNGVCVNKYSRDVYVKSKNLLNKKREELKDMYITLRDKKNIYDYNEIEKMSFDNITLSALKEAIECEFEEIKNKMNNLSNDISILNGFI